MVHSHRKVIGIINYNSDDTVRLTTGLKQHFFSSYFCHLFYFSRKMLAKIRKMFAKKFYFRGKTISVTISCENEKIKQFLSSLAWKSIYCIWCFLVICLENIFLPCPHDQNFSQKMRGNAKSVIYAEYFTFLSTFVSIFILNKMPALVNIFQSFNLPHSPSSSHH
jgi:hypothetical protein